MTQLVALAPINAKQRAFLAAYRELGNVTMAARAAESFMITGLPRIDSSAPKRRNHSDWIRTTTALRRPSSDSSGRRSRPSAGCKPSTLKSPSPLHQPHPKTVPRWHNEFTANGEQCLNVHLDELPAWNWDVTDTKTAYYEITGKLGEGGTGTVWKTLSLCGPAKTLASRASIALILALSLAPFAPIALTQSRLAEDIRPEIPRTWDDEALKELEVPLAHPEFSPVHVSSDYYYKLPVRPVYKSYPVYMPGQEPEGYIASLRQRDSEVVFDASRLKSREDWIRAGELVFDAPISTFPYSRETLEFLYFRWYRRLRLLEPKDGIVPYFRLVIREKGKLEVGWLSCAQCHTRVMPDGSLLKGAQGNFPNVALGFGRKVERARLFNRFLFGTPWLKPDPVEALEEMSLDQIYDLHAAIPPGVIARHRTSPFHPVQVPDLIGVKDRRYLDRTGLQQHRGVADMMRYAALNQGADDLASFGGFIPAALFSPDGKLPPPGGNVNSRQFSRYSDEQLYALGLFIYSLKPPENPHRFDERAARGQNVFEREGCPMCHTPPLYTNNNLTPARGFKVPEEHKQKYDILDVVVGTDPALAMETRRGTGYYKVPSLKGVWYRGPFEHSGAVATLEDWFDPARLRDDYIPTGFKGYGVRKRPVPGHEFGLRLSPEDKTALIAFLTTL